MSCGCKERRERIRRALRDEETRDIWIDRAILGFWVTLWVALFAALVWGA